MNREEIEQVIPHRDPFLWLDEVVELTDKSIKAKKFVSPDLDVFRGHYPEFPVLPGVLACEAAFQAGAVLISQYVDPNDDRVPVVTRIKNTKFRKMIRPGDTIDLEVTLNETVGSAYFLSGTVSVDGQAAVRIEFACAAAPATV